MEISDSTAMGKFLVNYVVTHPKRDRCSVQVSFYIVTAVAVGFVL